MYLINCPQENLYQTDRGQRIRIQTDRRKAKDNRGQTEDSDKVAKSQSGKVKRQKDKKTVDSRQDSDKQITDKKKVAKG